MPPSELERALAFQIRAKGLPKPVTEFQAIPGRKLRWDFAWLNLDGPNWQGMGLLLEIQGSIWKKGGHNTGTGMLRDMEKNNLAVLEGWRVLYVAPEHITSGEAIRWIEEALRQTPEGVQSK